MEKNSNEKINFSINKSTFKYIGIGVAAFALLAVVAPMLSKNGGSSTPSSIKLNSGEKVKIVASANKSVEFVDHNTDYVSIKLPKGWKIDEDTTSVAYYVLHVYNEENPDYQIFFNLKTDGYTKNASAKSYYGRWTRTKNSPQANLPVLSPATTENFFVLFSDTSAAVSKINKGVSYYPLLNNFKKTQDLGKINVGGDIIRGEFTGSKGKAEGIFTSTIKEMNPIYLGTMDVSYYLVYYTAFITTPENELINWEKPLLDCLNTLEFTEKFQTAFNNTLKKNSQTFNFNRKQSQEVSQGIMDSWEKRQKSLDIQSQKRSDATLGYERVYDTETGDVYKAYNGFTSDYSGNRYKAISDSQYSESIVGYIEK